MYACIECVTGVGYVVCYQSTPNGNQNSKIVALGEFHREPNQHRLGGQLQVATKRDPHDRQMQYELLNKQC